MAISAKVKLKTMLSVFFSITFFSLYASEEKVDKKHEELFAFFHGQSKSSDFFFKKKPSQTEIKLLSDLDSNAYAFFVLGEFVFDGVLGQSTPNGKSFASLYLPLNNTALAPLKIEILRNQNQQLSFKSTCDMSNVKVLECRTLMRESNEKDNPYTYISIRKTSKEIRND